MKTKWTTEPPSKPGHKLIYEDRLPDITDEEYSKWFKTSFVYFGVRMGWWPIPEPETEE
jgi:hypothetical protein